MNFSLHLWSFDEEKWRRFFSFYLPYLQETCRAEEYAEEEKEALGEGCRKGILSLSHRAPNPYLTFELMLDGKGVGFAQNIVFSDEHLKSLLANIYLMPEFRNKGYGSAFYALLEQDLFARGARYVDCSIAPKAHAFYQRKNFQKNE